MAAKIGCSPTGTEVSLFFSPIVAASLENLSPKKPSLFLSPTEIKPWSLCHHDFHSRSGNQLSMLGWISELIRFLCRSLIRFYLTFFSFLLDISNLIAGATAWCCIGERVRRGSCFWATEKLIPVHFRKLSISYPISGKRKFPFL